MQRVMKIALAGAAFAALSTATPASAAVTLLGVFSGTDCSGPGGFPNCYATQTGVFQGPVTDPLQSPAVYKINNGSASEINGLFATITGGEFTFGVVNNILSFTYTAGTGDPVLHYFSIKQGDVYALYYDANPITSGSVNLANLFPNNVGWSHITWFDTGAVPEPGTWAMMLLGFGGIGLAMRRRRRQQLMQIA